MTIAYYVISIGFTSVIHSLRNLFYNDAIYNSPLAQIPPRVYPVPIAIGIEGVEMTNESCVISIGLAKVIYGLRNLF